MKKNKEPIIARKMSIKVIYLKSFQRTHNKHLISNLRFLLCGKIPKKAKYCRTDCRKGLEYVFIALRFCRFFVHLFVCNYISVEFCGFFFFGESYCDIVIQYFFILRSLRVFIFELLSQIVISVETFFCASNSFPALHQTVLKCYFSYVRSP